MGLHTTTCGTDLDTAFAVGSKEGPLRSTENDTASAVTGSISHAGMGTLLTGDAAPQLPRHDLGQATQALRSRVSSSPKQRYDIQVG